MTDRLDCPDCGGSGERRIGPLVLQCEFCLGAGYVGGDNEPAEECPPRKAPPVWEQVGADPIGCPMCFGAGVVINLGDRQPAVSLAKAPCPVCQPSRS